MAKCIEINKTDDDVVLNSRWILSTWENVRPGNIIQYERVFVLLDVLIKSFADWIIECWSQLELS